MTTRTACRRCNDHCGVLTTFFLAATLLLAVSPAMAGVGPVPATDAELAAALEESLSRNPALSRARLQLRVRGGGVTLAGGVPTLALRRQAVRLLARQRGVLAIDDRLVLTAPNASDRTMEARLWSKLSLYSDLSASALDIEITEGVVKVSGSLGTSGRLRFLEGLLEETEGVRGTDLSGITVRSLRNQQRGDEAVERAVRSLIRNPYRFPISGRILVSVTDGHVLLTGAVPRLIDKMEAVQVAWMVEGVIRVEDEMEIDPNYGRVRFVHPGGAP